MQYGRWILTALLVAGTALPAAAQVAYSASGGSSSASPLLLGNNAGKGGATSSGRAIQPYTNYTAPVNSASSGKSIAELMSENSQGMADTGAKFANARAQRVEAEQMQEKLQRQRSGGGSGSGTTAKAAPIVVLQYTPPTDGSATPPRTFHID